MLKLKETNYDITEVKFMRCKRTFYFGGDASLECTWTVRLPLCETGWDFDLQEHQDHFIHRLRTEMPDEIYLAPSCHLWSQMQNLAARTNVQQNKLYLKRKELHGCHLMFVAQVYKEQVDNARHARIEQPERALSWHTTAFKDLPGHWIVFHQCMFGCACLDQDGWWKLAKKPTAILSRKVSMQAALSKQCDGQHAHCPLEGSAPGLGRRTSYLEDYQPGLAATIAAAICAPDPA